ncbi:metallophosphoesterase [Defluviimonas sp. WL0024]|uniref:Metallophosphoesterase n=1 Tax=Albidovulum salinarum TaxID=2984153 RepID=A0ABT2X4Z7_9RHOB|nr:metallophosphoesterase [Defluviimonas sp. WL0024]MCU9849015.1 metallophosphoesterase [Defluviimonas sp. WL0024]
MGQQTCENHAGLRSKPNGDWHLAALTRWRKCKKHRSAAPASSCIRRGCKCSSEASPSEIRVEPPEDAGPRHKADDVDMRILVTADWHLDAWLRSGRNPFAGAFPVFETLDALIIAGDIAEHPRHGWPNCFGWLRNVIDPEKVWVVPGNHDYYGWDLGGDDGLRSFAEREGINFAQKSVIELGGMRFLCSTLWTDFGLTGDPAAAMQAARRSVAEYAEIRSGAATGPFAIPEETLALHQDHRAWFERALREKWPGRTVVISHHAPSRAVAGRIDAITPAFVSDLDTIIETAQPDLWLFGHTHRPLQARLGRTRLRNCSLGYPSEVPTGLEARLLLLGLIDTERKDLLAPMGLRDACLRIAADGQRRLRLQDLPTALRRDFDAFRLGRVFPMTEGQANVASALEWFAYCDLAGID